MAMLVRKAEKPSKNCFMFARAGGENDGRRNDIIKSRLLFNFPLPQTQNTVHVATILFSESFGCSPSI